MNNNIDNIVIVITLISNNVLTKNSPLLFN